MQLLGEMQKNATELKNINYIVQNLYGILFLRSVFFQELCCVPSEMILKLFLVSKPGPFI